MRHKKPRRHPAKEQRWADGVAEAERKALEGLFDDLVTAPAKKPAKSNQRGKRSAR